MAREITFIVRESSEGGYEAFARGYSIYTEATTMEELKKAAIDAICCHFDDNDRPEVIKFQTE
jgi:hypothetical protein